MRLEDFNSRFPFAEIALSEHGDSWLVIPAAEVVRTCKTLRDEFSFDCLSCLTGTDRGDSYEVVYHLFSYKNGEMLILKVLILKTEDSIASVASVWPAANWMERETYDLLGLKFRDHPNLKRILLPEDWAGSPLRKDYTEPEEYAGMTAKR